jgi:hypothetical protein
MREEHPIWFDLDPDMSPGPGHIAAIEEVIGAALPSDYVWFLCSSVAAISSARLGGFLEFVAKTAFVVA